MGVLINLNGGRENGLQDAPANAMAKGLAVVIDSDTIDEAAAGERPDGFLAIAVTTDGLSWLELESIPHAEVEETKVSVGKIRFVEWEDGVEIATDNINSSFAVGDEVHSIGDGVLGKAAEAAVGDYIIGIVRDNDYDSGGTTGLSRIMLSKDLGKKA